MILNSPYITGSITVTGNANIQGQLTVTGSLSGIASTASFALTLGGTGSVGFATTGAFTATSGSASSRLTQIEQVYATTGSNSFRATQSITGSLTVTGQIIAQTLNVQQVTSSIVFSSGSNVFGCDLNSRQTFTGSVLITGSLVVNTTGPELQVTNAGVILGNLLTDNHSITGSLRITGSSNHFVMGCNLGVGNLSPTVRLQVSGTIATGDNVTGWGRFSYDAATNQARLQASKDGTDSIGLSFWTQATGGGFAERMAISGSNVGIGTSSPSSTLHISSSIASGQVVRIQTSLPAGRNYFQWANGSGDMGYIGYGGANSKFFIVNQLNDDMLFYTNDTPRMTITSTGNILVNQTSALAGVPTSIEMSGVGSSSPTLQASYNVYANHGSANTTWRGYLVFNKSRGTTAGSVTAVADGDFLGTLRWTGADGTGQILAAEINAKVDGTVGTNDMPTRLEFSTTADGASSPTERMRITSGGFTKASNYGGYFGATFNYHELGTNSNGNWNTIMYHTAASPYGIYIPYTGASPNSAASEYLFFTDTSATRFAVRSNGGIANFQANNVNLSDERTKKDIIPLESYWDKFKAIEIVKFKYKDQTHEDFNIGVIAQQVEAVAPEFVDVDSWEKPKLDENGNEIISNEEPLKAIYTADLHHATIKVLQEAMAKIEEQQSTINTLKSCLGIS